tara:strand:- start:47 stop:337 length:291 start_codon:yes stop_codon:yes gene_type:complete
MSSLIDRIANKAFDVVSDRAQAKIEDKELKIVIDDIYKQINSIKKKLTQLKPPANNFEGESGDVRVVKNKSDNKLYIEAKYDDGWAKTELTLKDEL